MENYNICVDKRVCIWKRQHVNIEAESIDDLIKKVREGNYEISNIEFLKNTEMPIDDNIQGNSLEIYLKKDNYLIPIYEE